MANLSPYQRWPHEARARRALNPGPQSKVRSIRLRRSATPRLSCRRLILPAFGTYAGGLNALDPAIAQLFPDDYDALVVGRDAVRRLSWRQLRPDAAMM